MKKIFLIIFIALSFASCKTDYEITRANTPIALPAELPNKYRTPSGVNVYSINPPPPQILQAIETGIQTQLSKTTQDIPIIDPPDIWKNWHRFKNLNEYEVLLIKSNYTAQDPSIKGCSLIKLFNGITAIGLTTGFNVTNQKEIEAPQPLIVMPFPENLEQKCVDLMRDGARHESEHVRLLNDKRFFLYWSGYNDIHPFFK